MPDLSRKKDILKREGFIYHFSREIYFNRTKKKIFALEAIEDNSAEWLQRAIDDDNVTNDWQFYFNETPIEEITNEIIDELGR